MNARTDPYHYHDYELYLRASLRDNLTPTFEGNNVGFRVASVPEPSSALLVMLGAAASLARRKWRKEL